MEFIDNIELYQKESQIHIKEHSDLSSKEAEILDWILGLCGESGEVSDLIKHHIFHKEDLDKMKLAKELGDVLWYVSAIASAYHINMNSIITLNVNKLRHRYGEKYNNKASAQRHAKDQEFETTEIYKYLKQSILKGDDNE